MDAVSSTESRRCGHADLFHLDGRVPPCRQRIIDLGREWLGTPYRHQASVKQGGCDCIGLVRGVYREYLGLEDDPEVIPPYQPDWYEIDHRDPLLVYGRRHLEEVSLSEMTPGDVLVFRMRRGASAKHCGLVTSLTSMIHAHTGRGVFEVSLGDHWLRKVAAVLRLPCPEE